jgi:hypothetical protein
MTIWKDGVMERGFCLTLSSQQGRTDIDTDGVNYESDNPMKQLAELTVLEVGFQHFAREERMRLVVAALATQANGAAPS